MATGKKNIKPKSKAKPKAKPTAQAASTPVFREATLRVERMALADLLPHPRNPRVHPAPGTPQWEALAASLTHDYFDPLVVNMRPGSNYMMLVSGHLRHKVLVASGYTHADVSVVDYDEATHLARLLAANRLQGEDLDAGVRELIAELAAGAFDIALTGIAQPDIDGLLLDPPVVNSDDQNTSPGGRMNRNGAGREVVAVGRWIGTAQKDIICEVCSIVERIDADLAAATICNLIKNNENIFSS